MKMPGTKDAVFPFADGYPTGISYMEFLRMGMTRTRFPEKIFYLFVPDTCEDIHEGSWNTFRQIFANMKLD